MTLRNYKPLLWVLVWSLPALSFADAYRSKVYLDPSKKISESVALSIEDLEQQLGSFTDSYAQSSAGRHLARHYVAKKQYAKAVDFYQQALSAEGMSAIANREMRLELTTVYLLQKNYVQALSVLNQVQQQWPELDAPFLMLLGQVQFKSGDFLALADTLDELMRRLPELSDGQLQQLLAMAYGSRNFTHCEALLERLIDRNPQSMAYWRQLTSVYLAQSKSREALNQLSLAREKRLPFSESDVKLLANLYMSNKAAEKGARTLSDAIDGGELKKSGEHYRQLFEYWLVAREKTKATQALKQAATLSNDTALYLKLAQMYMEQEDWSSMNGVLLQACHKILPDRYVGKANLLLGISQFKQNDHSNARRSLINATLIGSHWKKANQWLGYMQAAPASVAEMRSIEGPCRPQDSDVRVVAGALEAATSTPTVDGAPVSASGASVEVKVVEGGRFYLTGAKISNKNMGQQLRSIMVPLGVSLVRGGGSIDGPLHLFFVGDGVIQKDKISLNVGFPVKGNPRSKSRYKNQKLAPFKCAYVTYDGDSEALPAAWEQLFREALQAGYELTGQARLVIEPSLDPQILKAQLQLGVL